MTLAIAHSRGWLDCEERVCTYWPQFAAQGKEGVTVRQLLAHQAGLFAFDEPVDRSTVADLDRLALVLARQRPAWEPGTRRSSRTLRPASDIWTPSVLQEPLCVWNQDRTAAIYPAFDASVDAGPYDDSLAGISRVARCLGHRSLAQVLPASV
jgi:hypothetical protein